MRGTGCSARNAATCSSCSRTPTRPLDPRMRVGTILREPLAIQQIGSARSDGTDPAAARGGRARQQGCPAVPPRVLRWAASAHRLRPRAHAEPEAHRLRRARLRARRVDPGSAPQLDEEPSAGSQPVVHCHLPRPGGRQISGRPHRGHVPRQADGGRIGPGALRKRRPSLHAGPDRHDPGSGPGPVPRQGAQRDPGRAPLADLPALGLSLPHPVPVRREDLLRAGAAARAFGEGHLAACHFPLQTPLANRPPKASSSERRRCKALRTAAAQRRWSRTSSASRRASPMKLMATTTSTIASPAGTISHQ